jgi:3-oxoacyl-[acyl-carrier protein] reductase
MKIGEVRAVVTGAARGLGYTFALELARRGARVMAGDLNEAGLRQLADEARELPGQVHTAVVDVREEPAVKQFVREAYERMERVNVLVNNAGVLQDGLLVKEEEGWVKRLPTVQWKKVLDVNLTGPYLLAREVAAGMLEQGEKDGVIVNISSIAAAGNVGQSCYSASKAGLDAATRTWALELAPHGIRVAGIAPGVIETPILDNISREQRDALLAQIPLGRFGEPREVWEALRFILECTFCTGTVIEVHGGALL